MKHKTCFVQIEKTQGYYHFERNLQFSFINQRNLNIVESHICNLMIALEMNMFMFNVFTCSKDNLFLVLIQISSSMLFTKNISSTFIGINSRQKRSSLKSIQCFYTNFIFTI